MRISAAEFTGDWEGDCDCDGDCDEDGEGTLFCALVL